MPYGTVRPGAGGGWICLTLAMALVGLSAEARAAARPNPPNIVIMVADDLGWNDVSYHGGEIRTPNIDSLASQGVELDRFYVCSICTPTRSGLMTGRYPLRFGMMRSVVTPWAKHGMPPGEDLLPEMLERAGYQRRAVVGKWHLGHSDIKYHPLRQGFSDYYGHFNGAIDYFSHEREGALDWHRQLGMSRDDGYSTDLIADYAAQFIRESPSDKPFFLYVPFNAPHGPLQAPEKYLQQYEHLKGPRMQKGDPAKYGGQGRGDTRRQTYAAMVACMDDGIGRILGALDSKGIADETFVLFFSDNGGTGGGGGDNQPLNGGKSTLFEGGIRVPAAARWPNGLEGGRKVEDRMAYIDIYPTLLRVAGADQYRSKPLDGVDVFDAMRGTGAAPNRDLYFYWDQKEDEKLAVISGPWKLIREGPAILDQPSGADSGTLYLYKIDEDPLEKTNRAAEHPERAARLLEKLREFRALRSKQGLAKYDAGRENFNPPSEWIMPGE